MSAPRKAKPRFQVGDRVSFVYGPRRVNGEVVEDRGPLGAYGRRVFLVRPDLGPEQEAQFEVPEDNLENFSPDLAASESPGPRVEFIVKYLRRGATKHWQATVARGRTYQGMTVKGPVAYVTARWENEPEDDEKHGTITVFLEPRTKDSSLDDATGRPDASMIAEAKRLADAMFIRLHPDAQIDARNSTDAPQS